MNYRAYWNTVKSRKHEVNEDRLMFTEYTFRGDITIRLMVVADGMGGMENGDTASRNAMTGFLESFYSETMKTYLDTKMEGYSLTYDVKTVQKVMVEAVKAANRSVLRGADRLEETGSTISAVCIVENFAVAANVGDSPIYYYDSRKNKLTMVSQLQTEAELRAVNGEYERYSREYYEDEHRLTNYLGGYGDQDKKDIVVNSIGRIKPGDVILMGSDGAFGRTSEEQISLELTDSLKDGEKEEVFLDNLFQIARAEKEDDQTAIMYIIEDEEETGADEEKE